MAKINETTLEINLQALAHNYHFFRNNISQKIKFMGVVKASAYGSHTVEIAKKLTDLGADYLAVAYTQEGIKLRKANLKIPILVFHPLPIHFEEIITHKLTPSIFSKRNLSAFIKTAEKLKLENYPIHLKLNTGMNRLGFNENDLDFILEKITKTKAIKVEGVFSHLAASEDKNEKEFTLNQLEKFQIFCKKISSYLNYRFTKHICNTSGILNYPQAHFDMVRCGIGLYGYGNAVEIDKKLKPIASLKTIISQIHYLKKGDSVSYNRKFKAEKSMKIATLPLGYADGIHRDFGNKNIKFYFKEKPVPIIGDICMDMIMIDISGIDGKEGEEVLIFDAQQNAEKLAQTVNTISYELLTGISSRVKRVVLA